MRLFGGRLERLSRSICSAARGSDRRRIQRACSNDIDRRACAAYGFWRNEARLMRKDGSEFDAVTITTRVDMPDRTRSALVTVVRDVSKEKALQQQKERFVAYASHELRTPITNLKTRLYLMRRQPERMDEHMRRPRLRHRPHEAAGRRPARHLALRARRDQRSNLQDVVLQDVIRDLVMSSSPKPSAKGCN